MTDLVDTHVHVWDPQRLDYPWLENESVLKREFGPGHLDTGSHRITAVIVVEAGCRADLASAEVHWVESLSPHWPALRAMVAQAPLEFGVEACAEAAARPLVAGIRRNVQDEAPGFMTEPDFVAGVAALAPRGLTFDACVREHQLRELASLVDRCPDVTFVLDHLGKPNVRQRRRQPWFDDIADLARRPNVVAKLSGLTTEADWASWQPADILPYLRHAVDSFGPQRCMYGSDWPVMTLATSYQRWADLVVDAISDLSPALQDAVLAGTASRVYGI